MRKINVTNIEVDGMDSCQSYSFEIDPADYIKFHDIIRNTLECDRPDWKVKDYKYDVE